MMVNCGLLEKRITLFQSLLHSTAAYIELLEAEFSKFETMDNRFEAVVLKGRRVLTLTHECKVHRRYAIEAKEIYGIAKKRFHLGEDVTAEQFQRHVVQTNAAISEFIHSLGVLRNANRDFVKTFDATVAGAIDPILYAAADG